MKIELSDTSTQRQVVETKFSDKESEIIDNEIRHMSQKGIIELTTHEPDEILLSNPANVFTQAKKDGSHHLILNLKNLNKSVT